MAACWYRADDGLPTERRTIQRGRCVGPRSSGSGPFLGFRPSSSSLNRRDVDLPHRQHRFHHALRRGTIRIGHGFDQHARCDLPGKAPTIPAPAALAFFTAVANDRIPVTIGVFLVVGENYETHRLVRTDRWSCCSCRSSRAPKTSSREEMHAARPSWRGSRIAPAPEVCNSVVTICTTESPDPDPDRASGPPTGGPDAICQMLYFPPR